MNHCRLLDLTPLQKETDEIFGTNGNLDKTAKAIDDRFKNVINEILNDNEAK